jgi:branched-chain amino acid aminotransferase
VKSNDEILVAVDGTLADRPTISVFDRGFLYGDSVFETTRSYGGVPFRLAEHLARLAWSAEKLGFELPLTVADLVGEVGALLRVAQDRTAGEWVLRLMVTRGEGPFGLDSSGAHDPRRILFIQPLRPLDARLYREGISVLSVSTFRPSDAARGAKVGNYLESILALKQAKAAGAHEALILSHDSFVVEGTTSNVFAVREGKLVTPPPTETLLPGITRALVMEAARSLGLEVVERRMTPEDLANADEAFITSTIREVMPVVSIDGATIGDGGAGLTTRNLHRAFRDREGFPGPHPWE